MKKYQLGEFEEIVILTIGVLYNDAYGVSVKKEIEAFAQGEHGRVTYRVETS